MATVELRGTSRWWYGRQMINGQRRLINTDVLVRGERPRPDLPDGDERFRASRTAAEAKLQEMKDSALKKAHTEDILQAVHEARTGRRIGSVAISDLFTKWKAIPRRRTLAPAYVEWANGVFNRFAAFAAQQTPPCREMSDVSAERAVAFLKSEEERGITPHTWNTIHSLLKSAFAHLRKAAGMPENPFEDIPSRIEDPIHRRPFTPDDLKIIVEAASADDFMRPLIVTAMCTAMRRGDVCRLRWADVDLKARFITVKTAKTGSRVSIPMFPMLHQELSALPRQGPFVFPEAEEMYRTRPDLLNRRLMAFFRDAGYYDAKEPEGRLALPTETMPADWAEQAAARIRAADLPDDRKHALLRILDLYVGGEPTAAIHRQVGISKSTVSYALHQIEGIAGHPIVRRFLTEKPAAPHRDDMHAPREGGRHRVSVRGFHSFRTTWVTLALTAGVPIDLVRKVTGHRTADIVLQNYFQPGREQFRQVLQAKMPALLSNGAKTPKEQALEVLRGATAKTWKKDIERAIALLEDSAA